MKPPPSTTPAFAVVGILLICAQYTAQAFSPTKKNIDIYRNKPFLSSTRLHATQQRQTRARDLINSLVIDNSCYSSEMGALKFGEACSADIVYEDCYEPQPIVGRTPVSKHMMQKVEQRKGRGTLRLDRISDGDAACGFAWTWVSGNEEGLRGTTFVELNGQNEICYVREIPEPIFKPGDATLELLKAVTAGAEPNPPRSIEKKNPTKACELAKYLYEELQGGDTTQTGIMSFYSSEIMYRDFNYENAMTSKEEVEKFSNDFTFPGITFRPQRFDDGELSTCFTWEVCLMDAPETVKGVSLIELDPDSRKITYVRDVPESAIKPPILGKIARQLRPGLGVFQGVPLGSRPGGK